MKAQEHVNLYHTAGDTVPLLVKLSVTDDDGTAPVADGDDVTLHVRAASLISIAGEAKGDGSGSFAFPVATLPGAGNYAIDIDVGFAATGKIGTVARGRLFVAAEA